ncbi:MAG: HD domain-containing protein [Patescibacteria group bacterium]
MEKTIIEYLNKAEKLKSTLRHNWTSTGRQESSAEHTWRIALFFIILQEIYHLDVDPYKMLKMIIIHDLPEITSGDIAGWMKDVDPEKHKTHKELEQKNAKNVFSGLPEKLSEELFSLFEEFESSSSKEGKLGKALDRIESQLQHLEAGEHTWSKEEKGEHMLNYPEEALKNLGNENISNIWKIIRKDIEKITYQNS